MGRTLQHTGVRVPLLVAYSLELAEEWHPTKNVKFKRDEVPYNSSYRAWWRCNKNQRHEWPATVATRAIDKQGCPFCSGRKVLPEDSIATLYPKVASEFHPTKNGDLRPEDFAPKSSKRLWWLCSKDSSHEWETSVVNRTNGSRCRDCRRIEKSLAQTAPEIAAEWHPTKNGDLTPEMVASSSEKKVWWQCRHDSDHVWNACVATRTRRGGKCPGCRNAGGESDSRINGKFSARRGLDETAPELLDFWHPTKNGKLHPGDVSHGSSREVWWQCPESPGHCWKESIDRVYGRKKKCRQCPGGRNPGSVTAEKSLGHLYPKLLAEWHPTLNGNLDPMSLAPGSGKKPFWQCESDPEHVWVAHVFRRTKGSNCPFCSGLRADSRTSLAAVDAEIAATWHPTKNGDVTPADVTRQSATKRWWMCDANPDHVWFQSVQNRVNRRQCPECNKLVRRGKLESALARSISENVSSYATFADSIDSLSRLALLESSDTVLQQVL